MRGRNKKLGWGFLLLFSVPFAGVGTFMGYITLSCMVKWQDMKSWEEIPATIQTTDLVINRDSDSTTYKVSASYSYTCNNTN